MQYSSLSTKYEKVGGVSKEGGGGLTASHTGTYARESEAWVYDNGHDGGMAFRCVIVNGFLGCVLGVSGVVLHGYCK